MGEIGPQLAGARLLQLFPAQAAPAGQQPPFAQFGQDVQRPAGPPGDGGGGLQGPSQRGGIHRRQRAGRQMGSGRVGLAPAPVAESEAGQVGVHHPLRIFHLPVPHQMAEGHTARVAGRRIFSGMIFVAAGG